MGDEEWCGRGLVLFMEGEVVAEGGELYCGDTSWGGDVWGHWSIKGFRRELRLTAGCEGQAERQQWCLVWSGKQGQGWKACDHSGTFGRSVVEELDSLWDVKGSWEGAHVDA